MSTAHIALLVPLLGAFAASAAAEPGSLAHCARIDAAADRLACYDELSGRAALPASRESLDHRSLQPASPAMPHAKSTAKPPGSDRTDANSLLSRYWELEPADKRGIFNFVGYWPSYVMPVHLTSRINRAPQTPTQAAVPLPDYRHEEAKFQISLRTKVAEGLFLPNADLWAAFTLQATWQVYNSADSKPFRNTDYQPEAIYIVPTPASLRPMPLGWTWRYVQLGLAHQSNGQSDPLSRSWNRVYLGAGFEHDPWSLIARVTQRLNEVYASDNNPDLMDFVGRAEVRVNWVKGLHTASLLYRNPLTRARHGALQFEWTYPVSTSRPDGLRWIVQAFSGYGETLTDYNFRQTSLGVGVSFLQF